MVVSKVLEDNVNRRGFLKSLFCTVVAVATGGLAALLPRRKLRCKYTLESAQNLKTSHGLHAETELVEELSKNILYEIDQDTLRFGTPMFSKVMEGEV